MRGGDERSEGLFSYVSCEARVPANHALRAIRAIVDEALEVLSADFDGLYSRIGRPSIPPEKLLRALLLRAFYSIRSERQLMEQMDYNLLFRWFVGLAMDAPIWDVTVFTKNRERLLSGDVAAKLLSAIINQPRVQALLSDDHFSVDGTLIEAWASAKSFRPKDEGGPGAVSYTHLDVYKRQDYNLLFRWFVGLAMDAPIWDVTVFTKNRERLLSGDVAAKLLSAIINQPRVQALLSDDHFSVDGTLIEAWASAKSFRPKDEGGPGAVSYTHLDVYKRQDYNLLFRWFVGLAMDAPIWDVTVFTKNRERLLSGDVAAKLLSAIINQPRVQALLSDDHFSVDGTLIEAWASAKSFRPKDEGGPGAVSYTHLDVYKRQRQTSPPPSNADRR